MANSIIEQKPRYFMTPVGAEIIYVISNADAVANQTRVKFVAEVHISKIAPNVNSTNTLIGTFKTTPNNAGVGIFNFSNILENYVNSDNLSAIDSLYKEVAITDNNRVPIHLTDKYSLNNNSFRFFQIKFSVEYLQGSAVSLAVGTEVISDMYKIFNGYVKNEDILTTNGIDFGFDLEDFKVGSTSKKFLTNSPTQLYANIDDYGTFAFLQSSSTLANKVNDLLFTYYSSTGATLGTDVVEKNTANGAYPVSAFFFFTQSDRFLLYAGVYPANLRNDTTSTFSSLVTAGTIQGGYYTVVARDSTPTAMTQTYTINLNCPNERQYESVRLCWLNQWGAWDYYTFVLKSTKTINTSNTTYSQLQGTWNESKYRSYGHKGGKKTFRVNATESISINTDYISENDNTILQELVNSPEIYMLKGYKDITETNFLKTEYVTPVTLKTSSHTTKTIANDKLIQYSFEIEFTKTLKTQSV
tara:strand:- start:138 stop:1553 length:1416 start_codon:yes stop_codon:yes gene_type:complete